MQISANHKLNVLLGVLIGSMDLITKDMSLLNSPRKIKKTKNLSF